MKTKFIPIDYDYFDFEGRNYAKVIGRDDRGKRVCIIDSCQVYFWAILRGGLSIKQIDSVIKKASKIQLDIKNRKTKVEKVELHDKNFLGEKVKALKIFATNYKDLHDIADQLGIEEIVKRRGYDLGYITHYIIEKKLIPLNWYEISGEILNNSQEFGGIDSCLEVDVCIKLESFKKIEDKELKEVSDFTPKVLAYDIETDEFKLGEGEILMISLVSNTGIKKVISWKKPQELKNKIKLPSYVEQVKDESELIEKFIEYVKEISPDFLVGYYSDDFDLPYIKARCEKFKMKLNLGLDDSQPKFTRSSFGGMTGKINGIVHIDLLKFIRTAYSQYMQSETLSLNEVSKEFLGDTKKEFKLKHSSKLSEKDWDNYYEYNLQDSVLTLGLFEKMWPDIMEFSRVIQEPVFEASRNGMSKNVESFIIHNLEKYNEIPEKRPMHDQISERRGIEKYEGAFVYEPIPGIYENIAMFDFTSSYGSVIVTYNLSKSTFLNPRDESGIRKLTSEKEKDSYNIESGGEMLHFSKKTGFFPDMLKEIIEKRKQFKKELKNYQGKDQAIIKARSNAFKLLANASYGYQGFFGARYYCREAAAATAAFAKKAIKDAIDEINHSGYKVMYGDSVDGKTKVIIKEKGEIYEKNIEELFTKIDKKTDSGKEYNFKKNTKILTLDKNGKSSFKPIVYVMKHNCDKKMYRIHFTNRWDIDVTEDHSLMGYQSSHFNQTNLAKKAPINRIIELKPKEIGKKAASIICLKKIPNDNIVSKNYPKEVYEFIGYFIGDGSFMQSKINKRDNKHYYLRLSLGSDGEEVFKRIIVPLKKQGYIKNHWWSKTRKGDITLNGLRLIKLISQNCWGKDKKIIPKWLFYEDEMNIASFLRGLFSADGCVIVRNNQPIIKYTSIYDEYINETRKLLYRVGVSHSLFKENSINKYKCKDKIYSTGSYSKNIIIKDKETFSKKIGFIIDRKSKLAKIKSQSLKKKNIADFEFDLQNVEKIEEIKTKDYVYDLEVKDTHTFFANYILAHNTDSIAFLLEKKSEVQVKEFLDKLNDKLPGIMELELEGFFKRGIWVTKRSGNIGAKKKYALIDKNGNVKIRGFETVRRDWCKLAREVQNKVLRMILQEGNEKKSLEYVKEIVKKIKQRKISIDELIIKTQLKKSINEYKAISPHVIAAQKMQELQLPIDEGNLIEFYISEPTSDSKKKKLIRDRVKLPEEKGEYDIKYYLEHQILPAVENIFQLFNINIQELLDGKKQTSLSDF